MSSSSFAAAQQRILERQAQRQREAQVQQAAFTEQVRESPLSRLPQPLSRTASPLTSLWNTLVDGQGTRPAFRVGQVDAELLDEELLTLMRGQVGDGLKLFGPHLQDDWSREILLALRAILFKLSVWDNDASYGASLQNLRLADARQDLVLQAKPTRWQKALYGLVTVLGRYGWERWEGWLVDQEAGYAAPSDAVQRLGRLTHWLSTTHSIAAFAAFVVFLVNGRYRTLVDRLLRLRLVSPSNQIGREVSFEYLNRQLVWHAFTEFLLFVLPLVGISRWRRWLSRAWKKTKSLMHCAICYQDQQPTSNSEAEVLGANTGGGSGGIIGSAATDIVNPYETLTCSCIYCFVCLATKIEAEEGSGWSCLRCGESVIAKSVGFTDQQPRPAPASVGDAENDDNAHYDDIRTNRPVLQDHDRDHDEQTQNQSALSSSPSSSSDDSQWSLADPHEGDREVDAG
ncbi:hypothetical protein DV737_g3486, partial [Chaetothyriales sp. CBS 132003]